MVEQESKPRLSIVTINLNNAVGLMKTLDSVIGQKRSDVEYIVIDGGSSDSSVNILRGTAQGIDRWISEPDAGIYAAMNKGIAMARGEFICFMNSGDALSRHVLGRLFDRYDDWKEYDVVYGDIMNATRGVIEPAEAPARIFHDMPFRHQAALVRTELQRRLPFDASYQVAADYDFVVAAYLEGRRFYPTGICLAEYDAEGISNRRYFRTIKEYARILWTRHRGARRFSRVAGYLWGKKKFMTYLFLKRVLGEANYSAVRQKLRRASVEDRWAL
jgi:putative colanic acid biosynthesis glycosyltransferase